MKNGDFDSDFRTPPAQAPRRSARVSIKAQVKLRRRGSQHLLVHAFDFSPEGCKLEFLERPDLDETVWVTFKGMEPMQASVCWIEEKFAGVEFTRPVHPAVFEHLISQIR
ncbi:MAG TPA: PilZ domain-containing protein [Sphingomicrobium sp.]|nr:PilZ domain-containing protein [Sphingomicrobium sp.]